MFENEAKIVTSVRMSPALKKTLSEEAFKQGISVSEYCELLLYNRHNTIELNQKIEEQQEVIDALQSNIQALENNTSGTSTKKPISELNTQPNIYDDKRLEFLFNHLKGKADTIKNAYGKNFQWTYSSKYDVLIAFIYASKLNL